VPTSRTTLRRRATRGSHERTLLESILDEALVCHVAVSLADGPRMLPTAHVRLGEFVYLHGARANHLLSVLAGGAAACLSVMLLDGLVFSREAFHHSMNYRSAVLFGRASEVQGADEKRAVLRALVERMAPGRWDEVQLPSESELAATLVVRFPIVEGSAKVRSGPPLDAAELLSSGAWAGELPLQLTALPPRPDRPDARALQASPAVYLRARALGLGARATYERQLGELLLSTDLARVDLPLVHRFLCEESYWARGLSEAALRTSLREALCFGLYRGRTQLGFARVVTDLSRFAYLADVFVVPQARGQGLGKLLIAHILEHPDLRPVERWLLGTADAHGLYERFGFVPAPEGRYMVRRTAVSGSPGEGNYAAQPTPCTDAPSSSP
jgi:nitroimidazol reductase NimA-like FMN-containing flavoprotein (pyridoxamine 5'-phosphate oxidase superfamily)/GNAT superfamily N-acetyltransferase